MSTNTGHPGASNLPGDAELQEIEAAVVEATGKAWELVSQRFGGPLDVSTKDEDGTQSLVTDVDKASQELIAGVMQERFPGHMLLGEEDAPDEEPPAADYVWAVDPIDGTTNYVNGSPVHAVSVAVLHRGRPVAGAIQVPWPNGSGSALVHARTGGGAWWDGHRLKLSESEDGAPSPGRLTMVPGSLTSAFKIGKPLRPSLGEVRVSGSVAYELFMVATGSVQYSLCGVASVWDFAAGAVLVQEAGGATMALDSHGNWMPFEQWAVPYANDPATSKRMRNWKGLLIAAPPKTAQFVADNLQLRRQSWLRRTLNYLKR